MTRQEIYDKVKAHLLAQGRRALQPGSKSACVYRAPNGDKCAAGMLIADEHYSPDLEGSSAYYNNSVNDALRKSGVPEEWLSFVAELQTIHDAYSPEEWREELENLARKEGLNT